MAGDNMQLFLELIQYIMLLLMGIYTFNSFAVMRFKSIRLQESTNKILTIIIFIIHISGYITLYFQTDNDNILLLYMGELVIFILVNIIYRVFYPKQSRLLHNHMLLLLSIGFIMIARLSYDKAVKQVMITGISFLACLIIPVIVKKLDFIKHFGWLYGIIGIGLLGVVLILGTTRYGATNWLDIGIFSFQPSELVKLIYIFSIASVLQVSASFKRICLVSMMAAATVLILVLQKDLGGALIFFVTYVFMLYAATSKAVYLFSGLAGGSAAAYAAYKMFGHVRVRVMAWQNPLKYIDNEGYQMSQSLFAIGTGGWFGLGLNKGLPTSIPVVDSDFIFSAISEEMGGFFALCIILVYINCFIMLMKVALLIEDVFYRLLSFGFCVMFGFQVILSIGGVIKFIPSTGVTLPLISYGGSSIFATIFMFMVIQGIYLKANVANKSKKVIEQEIVEDIEDIDE